MKQLILMTLFFIPASSWACSSPPESLYQTDQKLVKTTPSIVVAEAVSIEGKGEFQKFEFTFKTSRVLKGNPPQSFKIKGYNADLVPNTPSNFDDHQLPAFWALGIGNTIQPGDCTAYGIFSIGQKYLIFLRQTSHIRSYENIQNNDDLWLKVVELLIDQT